jgi:hypothetical protein
LDWAPQLAGAILSSALLVALVVVADRRYRSAWMYFVLALLMPALFAIWWPGGLERWGRTISSPAATSVYYDGVKPKDLGRVLQRLPNEITKFQNRMQRPPVGSVLHMHSVTKPPGFMLLFRPFRALGAAGPPLVAWLIILTYAAGVFPMSRLIGDRAGRVTALSAYALMSPTLILAPSLDLIYPIFMLGALLLLRSGLERQRYGEIAVAALIYGLALCLSYLPLVWFAIFITPVVWRMDTLRRAPLFLAGGAALFLGVAALPHFLLTLPYTWGPLELFGAAVETSNMIDASFDRSYWKWLWGNLFEQLQFLGVPLVALYAVAVRRCRGEAFWTLIFALVLINLSGLTREETSRTWIFLTPLIPWALADEAECPLAVGLLVLHLGHIVVFGTAHYA